MQTLKKIIKSRTTWTVAALVIVNTVPAVKDFIPANFQPLADSILALATLYFKHNPSQEYGGTTE